MKNYQRQGTVFTLFLIALVAIFLHSLATSTISFFIWKAVAVTVFDAPELTFFQMYMISFAANLFFNPPKINFERGE